MPVDDISPPNSILRTDAVVLESDDVYPFHITAKRYTHPIFNARGEDPEARTLILLHSTGFHKEIWEPTLEELIECLPPRAASTICEIWSIECPNHGASAELNTAALRLPENLYKFTCENYAIAAHRFLLAGPSKGARIDFTCRKLLGIGHSLGGVAMITLQQLEPRITFQSIILIEPMLSPGGPEFLQPLRVLLVRGAYERRDVWPDRKIALDALKGRGRTRMWDPRSLDIYVKYGLQIHPGSKFKDTPYNGVTLCCTRDEEASMYRDVDGPIKPVLHLNEVCSRMPVHIIFGTIIDTLPREAHDALVDSSSPRRFASISRIEKAGHLVPHHAPAALAKRLAMILAGACELRSKL